MVDEPGVAGCAQTNSTSVVSGFSRTVDHNGKPQCRSTPDTAHGYKGDPMGRWRAGLFVVVSFVVLLPSISWAQSSITGVVRDTSGAVLPGVTVEAASPALIEKVRVAVTDGQGVYRIVDLRPGPYTVTFTLTGFNTFRRTGIELRAEFTAAVDAELMLGTVEETITVTGEAPLVDTRSARAQTQCGGNAAGAPGTGRLSTLISVCRALR